MPTPLSNEGKLLAGLGARNMPVAAFAEVAKLDHIKFASTTKLNESFRDAGAIPLNPNTAAQCLALWEEIEDMCIEFVPAPLDLRDGETVHELLKQFRDKRILGPATGALLMSLCELLAGDGKGEKDERIVKQVG